MLTYTILRKAIALGIILLSAYSALAVTLPAEQVRYVPGTPYKTELISLESSTGGITLHGTLLLPIGSGLYPAVVLLPDMGAESPTYDDLLLSSLADSLASQGVVALRLQERGTGNSGGKVGQTLLSDRLADLTAAMNKLRTQPKVDITRIGVIGYGLGGNVALLAGAQPLPPAFIVAIAASGISGNKLLAAQLPMYGKLFTTNYDVLERQQQQTLGQLQIKQVAFQMQAQGMSAAQVETYTNQQTSKLVEADQRWLLTVQKHQQSMLEILLHTPDNGQARAVLSNMLRQRYPNALPEEIERSTQLMISSAYRDFLALEPTARLSSIKCPVLLVQGAADTQVNPATNLDALLRGLTNNSKITERRFKDLDHHLRLPATTQDSSQPAAPVVYREISHWLKQIR